MNITQAIEKGRQCLSESDSPVTDSQYMLCYVLACKITYLHTWPEKNLSEQQGTDYEALLFKRKKGMPVAYLIGQQGFWSLELDVNAKTLIPRPDTEILVAMALEKIQLGMVVADLGTGSGAIALALASEKKDVQFLAMDRSQAALKVAQANAKKHKITKGENNYVFLTLQIHFQSQPPKTSFNYLLLFCLIFFVLFFFCCF
jgi:release factor glutamine methyltransferase